MNARLPDLTRVDLAVIAAAVGRHPRKLREWIKHPAWPKGQEVGKGGRLTWAVDELPEALPRKRGEPVKVKQAVVMYLARQMARASGGNHEHVYGGRSGVGIDGRNSGQAKHAVDVDALGWSRELHGDAVLQGKKGGVGWSLCALPAAGRASPELPRMMTAPGGQSIPAGLPSPVDSSPAATGADGLTGGGGAGCALVSPGLLASCGDGTGRNPVDGQASAGKGQLTLGAGSIPATSAIMIL
jgi:hypothetical protein